MTVRDRVPMTMSGFCAHPTSPAHAGCRRPNCACECHHDDEEPLE